MEKKPIENIAAVIVEEQLAIKTTNAPTGTVDQAQASSQSEAITVATTNNVVKTRH